MPVSRKRKIPKPPPRKLAPETLETLACQANVREQIALMLRAAEPAKPHLAALRNIGLAAEAKGLNAEPWFRVGADFGAVLELLEGLADDLGRPELAEASNSPA